MAPVLVPALAPPATSVPTELAINKRGCLKRKRNSRQTIFRGEKKKIQGNPTPVKSTAKKGASSKAMKASKPNSLPVDKFASEK